MALNLLDVNNDCLITTFTNLSVPELADIAATCNRFKTIARDVFSRRHQSFCLEIDVEDLQSSNELIENSRQTAGILRNFGDLLKKVKISFVEDDEENRENTLLHTLFTKYCGGGNLETLELANIYDSIDGFEVVASNMMLKVLWLATDHIDLSDSAILRLPRLEKLQSLTMVGPTISMTNDGLVALVRRLPALEQLQIAPNSSNEGYERIKLRKQTYFRICEIYRDRNHKLVIRNYDASLYEDDDQDEIRTIEPFAGENQQELVQFIAIQRLYTHYPEDIYI